MPKYFWNIYRVGRHKQPGGQNKQQCCPLYVTTSKYIKLSYNTKFRFNCVYIRVVKYQYYKPVTEPTL